MRPAQPDLPRADATRASAAVGLHRIALADVPGEPWRNGGGRTRTLLVWPAEANEWSLRVSVADIESDGPFSAFPGIDRWFSVLQGAGVVLALTEGKRRIAAGNDAVAFDGESAPSCSLVDGVTLDLNLMTRRSHGRGWMRREPAPADWRGVYADGVLSWTDHAEVELPRLAGWYLGWTAS
jgi:uncharacterized protein